MCRLNPKLILNVAPEGNKLFLAHGSALLVTNVFCDVTFKFEKCAKNVFRAHNFPDLCKCKMTNDNNTGNNDDRERCVTPVNQIMDDSYENEALWAPARPARNNAAGGDEPVRRFAMPPPWAPQRPGPRSRLQDDEELNNLPRARLFIDAAQE